VERYFLQLPGYKMLDAMGKGITLPVFSLLRRERESTSSRSNQSELYKYCSNCRGPLENNEFYRKLICSPSFFEKHSAKGLVFAF